MKLNLLTLKSIFCWDSQIITKFDLFKELFGLGPRYISQLLTAVSRNTASGALASLLFFFQFFFSHLLLYFICFSQNSDTVFSVYFRVGWPWMKDASYDICRMLVPVVGGVFFLKCLMVSVECFFTETSLSYCYHRDSSFLRSAGSFIQVKRIRFLQQKSTSVTYIRNFFRHKKLQAMGLWSETRNYLESSVNWDGSIWHFQLKHTFQVILTCFFSTEPSQQLHTNQSDWHGYKWLVCD